MPRRIEIELTSLRDDGTLTWRAAGAREPKGVVESSLLPDGSKVGDVLRAEVEHDVDGVAVTGILTPRAERTDPDRIELIGGAVNEGGVTTSLVGRRGRARFDDDGGSARGPRREQRRDRRGGGEGRAAGKGTPRRGPSESGPRERPRRSRPEREPASTRPKARRLRPKRVNRDAAIVDLPEIQRPLAKEVMRGGIPGLRKVIEEQNADHRSAGRPEVDPAPLLELAEALLPALKSAEWRDRAEAAIAGLDDLDLRDLRSVVVAAESGARTEESRALAEQLREGLSRRVEAEHEAWLNEMSAALRDERTVRALRMSSRPPKAGALMPADLTQRLTDAAAAALTGDTAHQRWATVLDAVAFSPVRQAVVPQSVPDSPSEELLDAVRRLSTRVPQIATLFGIEPSEPPRRRRSRGRSKPASGPEQA